MFKVPEKEIERCAQRISDVRLGEDVGFVLREIEPTLLKLRNGKVLLASLEKLLRAGEVDRALTLLRAMPRTRASTSKFIALLSPLWILGAVGLFGTLLPRCDGAYEPAFKAINACPQAVELLGQDIQQAPLGLSCGSSETGGGSGRASWSVRVSGSKGSGSYSYAGSSNGSGWKLHRASLEVGDQEISIAPCGAMTKDPLNGAVEYQGTVNAANGKTSAKAGDTCTISVSPSPEDARAQGLNCHIKVKCGANVIYGWEGSGVTQCKVEAGKATHANDAQGAALGDDPILSLDLAAKRCKVSDDADKAFNVEIQLAP
jgi:hypothetical protein